MKNESPLGSAISRMGGVVAAARLLNLKSYQVVQQWLRAKVPAEHCPAIERATSGAVRCEDLRPDVDWAYLRNSENKTKEAA